MRSVQVIIARFLTTPRLRSPVNRERLFARLDALRAQAATWISAPTSAALAVESDVTAHLIEQNQTGELNVLEIQLGRVQDKQAIARVMAHDIEHTQRGGSSLLRLRIGNALEGGRSDVIVHRLKQDQLATSSAHAGSTRVIAGGMSQRQMGGGLEQWTRIGKARYVSGSRATVSVSTVRQLQFGNGLAQILSIGNALGGGKTRVNVSDITQIQSGEGAVKVKPLVIPESWLK